METVRPNDLLDLQVLCVSVLLPEEETLIVCCFRWVGSANGARPFDKEIAAIVSP
jgi:hypothetical protein